MQVVLESSDMPFAFAPPPNFSRLFVFLVPRGLISFPFSPAFRARGANYSSVGSMFRLHIVRDASSRHVPEPPCLVLLVLDLDG